MILHLIHDDKVVPRMISLFEKYNADNNLYICVTRKKKESLFFLRDNPKVVMAYSKEEKKIPWESIDKVIFHYYDLHKDLYLYYCKLFFRLKEYKIIWFEWGGDVYPYLEKKGFQLYSDNNSYKKIQEVKKVYNASIKYWVSKTFGYLFDKVAYLFARSFYEKRVDYIACFIEEYKFFQKYISFKKCKGTLHFTYYSIEDTLGELYTSSSKGNSIMIGNSASETNNHEYSFDFIKELDLKGREIILPLNYSGSEQYINIVIEKYKIFPNVVFLRDFLRLQDYNRLMISCSTFIYGNFRQEAWGNILISIYLGGKVYLSKNSPLVDVCRQQGFKIFILEDIKSTFDQILSVEEKMINRRLALQYYSAKINEKNIKSICAM